jgi:hypothetical protein
MISKMQKLIISLVCLFPVLVFANIGEGVGYWAVKCGGFGGSVEIESSNEVKININDNNLYVSGFIQKDYNGQLNLFYKDVIETMNETIDWTVISQSKPIADVTFKNGTMHMKWKGFFDTKHNNYIWKSEPDFVVASGDRLNVEMNKCEFK